MINEIEKSVDKYFESPYCPSGADEETRYQLKEFAVRLGLDPMKREIQIRRNRKGRFYVTLPSRAYNVLAESTGEMQGFEFEYSGKGENLEVTAKIYREGWVVPGKAVAHFSEYARYEDNGELTSFWYSKARRALENIAMAMAVRMTFPDVCAQIPYIVEELDQDLEPEERKTHAPGFSVETDTQVPPEDIQSRAEYIPDVDMEALGFRKGSEVTAPTEAKTSKADEQ